MLPTIDHTPVRFHASQQPSTQVARFSNIPNLTSPITIQQPLGKSEHVLLQLAYTFSGFLLRRPTLTNLPVAGELMINWFDEGSAAELIYLNFF